MKEKARGHTCTWQIWLWQRQVANAPVYSHHWTLHHKLNVSVTLTVIHKRGCVSILFFMQMLGYIQWFWSLWLSCWFPFYLYSIWGDLLLSGDHSISISHFIWFCAKTHFLLVWIQEEAEIELGADSKCAPEDEGKKLKVKILVKWSGKDWLAWAR